MTASSEHFSSDYTEAREKFMQAARAAALMLSSCPLDLRGRDGEELAIDIAHQGRHEAELVLLLSCGTHGIEGLAGSGVLTALLRDADWIGRVDCSPVTVVYVHALNPHGFSHGRRVTQENVDLNRNFQDFSAPLPPNPAYSQLHPLLLPDAWPPNWRNRAATAWLIATHGVRRLQTAMSGGQYERADGMFFGGSSPTWSHHCLRRLLREHTGGARRLAWIDLHTGLGRPGHCERGFMGEFDAAAAFARANAWWGQPLPVVHIGSRSSQSGRLTGLIWNAAVQECPQAEFTGMYMEFGTQSALRVLDALRGDHWLYLHPQAPAALARHMRRKMRDAFFVDEPRWKQALVHEVRSAVYQALNGLQR